MLRLRASTPKPTSQTPTLNNSIATAYCFHVCGPVSMTRSTALVGAAPVENPGHVQAERDRQRDQNRMMRRGSVHIGSRLLGFARAERQRGALGNRSLALGFGQVHERRVLTGAWAPTAMPAPQNHSGRSRAVSR